MDLQKLECLHSWFDEYSAGFYNGDAEYDRNIQLKIEHTAKVCEVMEQLAEGERLAAADALTARVVALLHDVGRFPQFRRWRTFRDRDSDNHGRLAVEVIREQGLLADLENRKRLLIEEAVRFHNLLAIPCRLRGESGLFLRLVRDADKLDIWRVFTEHFSAPEKERASAALLGFPDLPLVSDACLQALNRQEIVSLDLVRSVNDFKMLLMSWVFDLNFASSYRLLTERNLIGGLGEGLPDTPAVRTAVSQATEYASRRASFD